MRESALRLGKCVDPRFSVAVDFGSLAGETGTGPSLCVLRDAVPYKLLLGEGSCGTGRRMGEAMDKVEDSTAERKSDPRARAARIRVAEDCPYANNTKRDEENVVGRVMNGCNE